MLAALSIQNLILIENASFFLDPHLNIITGETGAGKSALLTALRMIRGEKSSVEWIGQQGDVASVEAVFSNGLKLQRSLDRSGKNRCSINGSSVSLSILREMAQPLLEIVDQGSFWTLQQEKTQRDLLDAFSESEPLLKEVASLFKAVSALEAEQTNLQGLTFEKERRLDWIEKDLALLEEVEWDEKEDASLEEEHRILAQKEKLFSLLSPLLQEEPLLPDRLIHFRKTLEKGALVDPKLSPLAEILSSLNLQLQEVFASLENHLGAMEISSTRMHEVETRLAKISSCKKRFGGSRETLLEKKKSLTQEKETLLHLEERLTRLEQEIECARKKLVDQAFLLTQKRSEGASDLSQKLALILSELGLPHAKMIIALSPKTPGEFGADQIDFLFSANPDHPPKPLSECASGGEISRILLALKIALSAPEAQCLVFDEIDSNVGGRAALLLGKKLQTLAERQQILCITHFVQVAKFGSAHFLVTKEQSQERTQTSLRRLTEIERENEYARMTGMEALFIK